MPGFERYSVLGNDSQGTFNLQVIVETVFSLLQCGAQVGRARLEDEAKYECQVGPGGGNPPIRANAFLTVNRQ